MRKIHFVLLSFCLLIVLAACGNKPASPPEDMREPAPPVAEETKAAIPPAIATPNVASEETDAPQEPFEEEPAAPDDMPDVSQAILPAPTEPEQGAPSTAGTAEPETPPTPEDPEPPSATPSVTQPEELAPAPDPPKILIAYFTWADNTYVEDPSTVDPTIDAPSSASILPPGDTARIGGWIQQEIGGTLHSIITSEPYSSDYDECLDRAIAEHDNDIRPTLSSSVTDMADYDIVFLGYPNWWYSCPMAILTFIEENDLSGKTIVPYCTHGTGGLAASLRDIQAALPSDCTVLQEFHVYRADVRSAQPDVLAWLEGLEL